jgi:hypothetical protein
MVRKRPKSYASRIDALAPIVIASHRVVEDRALVRDAPRATSQMSVSWSVRNEFSPLRIGVREVAPGTPEVVATLEPYPPVSEPGTSLRSGRRSSVSEKRPSVSSCRIPRLGEGPQQPVQGVDGSAPLASARSSARARRTAKRSGIPRSTAAWIVCVTRNRRRAGARSRAHAGPCLRRAGRRAPASGSSRFAPGTARPGRARRSTSSPSREPLVDLLARHRRAAVLELLGEVVEARGCRSGTACTSGTTPRRRSASSRRGGGAASTSAGRPGRQPSRAGSPLAKAVACQRRVERGGREDPARGAARNDAADLAREPAACPRRARAS